MTRMAKLAGICVALAVLLLSTQMAMAAPAAERKAEPRIIILPFQINAGPEQERLVDELPAMLEQRLVSRGVAVVSERAAYERMRRDKITSLDIAIARRLAAGFGATAAVYGSYTQAGDAFSIDARYVEVGENGLVRPIFVEKNDPIELLPAVEELATRINNEMRRRELVAEVEVRGTRVLDPDVVLMRINTRKGDVLDVNAIDNELKRVWDLGYFHDVSTSVESHPDGMHLIFTVQEKPRIESIVVEGNDDIDEDDILAAMSTRTGAVLNEKLLAEDLLKIREVFRKEGYYLGTVEHRVETRQDGASAALMLDVKEGNKLYIKSVRIEGAKELDEEDIKEDLIISERGLFSWLTGSGVLREEMVDRDASAIGSYYMNHGFMDIEVGAAKIDYQDDGITVVFPINEGMRYKVNKVTFEGELIDTDEVLRQHVTMDETAEENGFFSLADMQEDAKGLADFYSEYGYAFAEINPMPQKLVDQEGLVDIHYQVFKKNRVYIRRAIIEGNTRTRDNVILRELRISDGDMFMGSRLQRSIQRLNLLDFFEQAEAELVPTGNDEEVDLKINIKEKSTGAIMAGFGYSTFSAFGVSGTIMEKNLFGKGYATGIQGFFSERYTSYSYFFRNPRVWDTNLSFGMELYNSDYDYWDYAKDTTGGTIRLGYPLGEYSSIALGYRLDQYRLYDFDNDNSVFSRYAGRRWSSVASIALSRNTTDAVMPTKGTTNRLIYEYGGGFMGGDDDFMKITAEHNSYYSLREHHVLHMRLRGSALLHNGSSEVPVFERFWMGGMDTVRGYASRDIVPRDPYLGDRIGGTRMAFANLEYVWTIAPEIGVHLVPFFDVGVDIDLDQDYTWEDELKRSFGLELRWRSPMGDLRFAYGIPLDKERNGSRGSGRFEFSMGQQF